ncbi:U32 family peptidase [Candidatus Woesearchaeota archaeon]|nr:U32 family peptidase [Candidatus Woesearchaeota archaeon]
MVENKVELLAPVGNTTMLRAAINSGADSVYFGLKNLNMRAKAKNFELGQLKKIVEECHKKSVKAYLTLNTIIYDDEIGEVKKIVSEAKKVGVNAVICWDASVIEECKKQGVEFHISTQASISNFESIKHYANLGAKRVVLARECGLEQIKSMVSKIKKEKLGVEVEVFVHGAMCVSLSGRCFTSQFLYGRSANRGECLQPCRRSYKVIDSETNDELSLDHNFVMSAKDLSTIGFLDKLIEADITCFKIEGRMRSEEYVSVVTKAYREAINAYYEKKLNPKLIKKLAQKLGEVYNKGFSNGFYLGKPIGEYSDSYGSKSTKEKVYVGRVNNYYKKIGVFETRIENEDVSVGDKLMISGPSTGVALARVLNIQKNKDEDLKKAKKNDRVGVKTNVFVRRNDKVFKLKNKE